jgi:hypothetical protein
MTVVALSFEPSWREPVPETERIIMVDFAATQGWVKRVVPSANRVGGARPRPLQPKFKASYLHPPSMGVDRMYHQLAEIHAIAAA